MTAGSEHLYPLIMQFCIQNNRHCIHLHLTLSKFNEIFYSKYKETSTDTLCMSWPYCSTGAVYLPVLLSYTSPTTPEFH